jgi:transcriptional regulator with XRE-family HTH domain
VDRPSLETILDLVLDGKTYREIGDQFGVNASTVCRWLNADDVASQQSARAREESAEAWLDRGLGYLERALDRDGGLDAGAARALAQECARRAAVRNPRYRDKSETTLKGDPDNPIGIKVTFG